MPGSLTEIATERLLHPRRRLLDDPTASLMPISGRDRTTQELGEWRIGVDRALLANAVGWTLRGAAGDRLCLLFVADGLQSPRYC